jgi:lysophospholipase L1-like esterase
LADLHHVVLLGDSVFDNGAYVPGCPDVAQQVQAALSGGHTTLLARDGAVLSDVASQLNRIPSDVTHVVVSAGGNDALRLSGVLEASAASVGHALQKLGAIRDEFRASYATMLERLYAFSLLPIAVCTIYEPRFPDAVQRTIASTALAVLNDVITREAFTLGLSLIDLRIICDEDEDFTNAIEPSARGGAKIARAIDNFISARPACCAVFDHRKDVRWQQRGTSYA